MARLWPSPLLLPPHSKKLKPRLMNTNACKPYVLSWWRSTKGFAICVRSRNRQKSGAPRKKTAAAIHQEIVREIDTLLPRIFAERRKTGDLDVEAVELAWRTALHAGGAAGLTEFLRDSGPIQASVPCACGGKARYKDMRSKPIVTVL